MRKKLVFILCLWSNLIKKNRELTDNAIQLSQQHLLVTVFNNWKSQFYGQKNLDLQSEHFQKERININRTKSYFHHWIAEYKARKSIHERVIGKCNLSAINQALLLWRQRYSEIKEKEAISIRLYTIKVQQKILKRWLRNASISQTTKMLEKRAMCFYEKQLKQKMIISFKTRLINRKIQKIIKTLDTFQLEKYWIIWRKRLSIRYCTISAADNVKHYQLEKTFFNCWQYQLRRKLLTLAQAEKYCSWNFKKYFLTSWYQSFQKKKKLHSQEIYLQAQLNFFIILKKRRLFAGNRFILYIHIYSLIMLCG
jgi:hypothetical protein